MTKPTLPSHDAVAAALAAEGLTLGEPELDAIYAAYQVLWTMLRQLDDSDAEHGAPSAVGFGPEMRRAG